MEIWHFVWMLAAVTGLVAAGVTGSGWAVVTGRRPSIWLLADYSVTTPVRAFVLAVYAPLALVRAGLEFTGQNPVLSLLMLGLGLFWSFLQGVFILTTFFGFT